MHLSLSRPAVAGLSFALLVACAHAPATSSSPKLIASLHEGLQLPESVLHDAENDVYLVSNINGDPLAKDNNGFISRVAPDGRVLALKWIAGGRNGVQLHAPKGSATAAGVLYVADIDEVRMFDARTGAPRGSIAVPGATFLNDVAADAQGRVYVTDSGLRRGAAGFEPTGTDAVYLIAPNRGLRTLLRDPAFGLPNGVLATGDGLLIANFGTPQLVPIGLDGAKGIAVALPKAQLDGIVAVDGDIIVSSWEGSALYRGKRNGPYRRLLTDIKSPGDIGYDATRRRLLVPLVFENRVLIYELPR